MVVVEYVTASDFIRLCPEEPPTENLTEEADPVHVPLVYEPMLAVIALDPSPEPKVITILVIVHPVAAETVKLPPP